MVQTPWMKQWWPAITNYSIIINNSYLWTLSANVLKAPATRSTAAWWLSTSTSLIPSNISPALSCPFSAALPSGSTCKNKNFCYCLFFISFQYKLGLSSPFSMALLINVDRMELLSMRDNRISISAMPIGWGWYLSEKDEVICAQA